MSLCDQGACRYPCWYVVADVPDASLFEYVPAKLDLDRFSIPVCMKMHMVLVFFLPGHLTDMLPPRLER